MIALASGLRVYLACGVTDMRKGMTGLAMLHADEAAGAGPVRLAFCRHDGADHPLLGAAGGATRRLRVAGSGASP